MQNKDHYAVFKRPFKVTDFGTNRKLIKVIYDFLIVIDTKLPTILHRFRDITFDRSGSIESLYLATLLAFKVVEK